MTTTTAANAPHEHSPAFSRLARFGTFGFKGARPGPGPSTSAARQADYYQSDANEDTDWVIPYNGPLEPPPDTLVGSRGDRDSWAGQIISDNENDGFERVRAAGSAINHAGGASTSGHGHGHGYSSSQDHGYGSDRMSRIDERARNRMVSPLSNYSVSVSTFGAGGPGSGGSERRTSNVMGSPTLSPVSARRAPVPTFLQLDTGGGVGMSPVPSQRMNHGLTSVPGNAHDGIDRERGTGHGYGQPPTAASPALSPRESIASLWTFGRSGSKKSPPVHASSSASGGPRPSSETHFSKQSVSSRQTGPGLTVPGPRDALGTRERSATVTEPTQTVRAHRPRSNTAMVMMKSASANGLAGSGSAHSPANFPRNNHPPIVIEPDTASSNGSYNRHPYASALPPTGHRQNSQLMQPTPSHLDPRNQPLPPTLVKRHTHTTPTLSVPFLSPSKSINSLKRSAKNLKASVSTPNLRGPPSKRVANNGASSADAAPSTPSATGSNGTGGSKWLSAETWCDALLFPRPRFRLRGAAHIISPPMSPTEFAHNPPHSAPPPALRTRKRSLLGLDLRGRHVASSAPPEVPEKTMPSYEIHPPPREQPQAGPSKPIERPPRPKSFAQDDLAIPSPVPSLATVLKQNAAFDKEREQWKEQAARSIGNKRSRSLSRSRAKVRLKNMQDQEHDSELATSFGMLATSAFTGNQTLRPVIHFAPTPHMARDGANTTGTSTAFTGLNSTSSHSRNVSASSQGGYGSGHSHSHGHGRKGSWGQTAINAAKSTANATGLCNFNQDVSPADEKVMFLDPSLARDRSKFTNPNVYPQIKEPDFEVGEDVIIISPQKEDENVLRRMPSHQSYISEAQSGVGIAVSTPTALVDSSYRHPFASGTTQSDSVPRGSDYAGPHPSRKGEYVAKEAIGDANFSRRLAVTTERPSSTTLHPYSAFEARPGRRPIRIPTQSISPSHKMFAEVSPNGIREVYPDEIQYSPYSSRHPGSSSRNSDALGVEEALAAVLSFRSDSQTTEDDFMHPTPADDSRFDPAVQELVIPALARTGSYRGLLMPQIEELRESWQTTPDVDVPAGIVRESPPPAYPRQGEDSITPNSNFRGAMAKTSPGMISINSSPMTSPRQFKQFDDMEDYSDIFYRAPDPNASTNYQGGGNSNGSSERPTPLRMATNDSNESTWSADRPVLSRNNSALTTLKRQFSQKYVENIAAERQLLGDVSNHVDDGMVDRGSNLDEVHAMVSQASSPPGTTLPLRAAVARPESSGPTVLIPEDVDVDVESSRASSILERFDADDGTEVIYRVKEVPSQSTPPINKPELVSESRHGSYIDSRFNTSFSGGQVPGSSPSATQNAFEMRMRPSMSSHSGSLKPQSATRASYVTSTSSSSRISESQLSNFPAPPNGHHSLTPGTIIQSYFRPGTPGDDEGQEKDAMAERQARPHRIHFPLDEEEEKTVTVEENEQARHDRASRRTTFGTFDAEPF